MDKPETPKPFINMLLEIKDLRKKFGRQVVLDGLTARFEYPQSVALLGPNGSGKTTLLKCLLGMVIPDAGRVYFDGQEVTGSTQFRERVGYMPQIGRYPEHMTVGQLFDMITDLRKHARQDTELYETFRIGEFSGKALGTLSGGMRQKVGAALAFLFDPDLLILDEPTAGLDPAAAERLKEKVMKERSKGKLLLITSHILGDLEELTTDLMYLQEGKVGFFRPIEALRTETGHRQMGKVLAALF